MLLQPEAFIRVWTMARLGSYNNGLTNLQTEVLTFWISEPFLMYVGNGMGVIFKSTDAGNTGTCKWQNFQLLLRLKQICHTEHCLPEQPNQRMHKTTNGELHGLRLVVSRLYSLLRLRLTRRTIKSFTLLKTTRWRFEVD